MTQALQDWGRRNVELIKLALAIAFGVLIGGLLLSLAMTGHYQLLLGCVAVLALVPLGLLFRRQQQREQ
jgi:uncharacterized membrane protein YccC